MASLHFRKPTCRVMLRFPSQLGLTWHNTTFFARSARATLCNGFWNTEYATNRSSGRIFNIEHLLPGFGPRETSQVDLSTNRCYPSPFGLDIALPTFFLINLNQLRPCPYCKYTGKSQRPLFPFSFSLIVSSARTTRSWSSQAVFTFQSHCERTSYIWHSTYQLRTT